MELQDFSSRQAAALQVAELMAGAIRSRLAAQDRASIVVTGGSSPSNVYAALSEEDLDWGRVDVVLSDERWVPASHDDSNEGLVRRTLATAHATPANILPFHAAGTTLEARCDWLDDALRSLPSPFASTLLGVGPDGHFASLFPDAANLAAALDPDGKRLCVPVHTAASPYGRISLTMPCLLASESILLLIFGDDKRHMLEQAAAGQPDLPVAHLLQQTQTPVRVFWAA